jgi:hypothetical protein
MRRTVILLVLAACLTGAASAEAKQLTRYAVGGGIAGRADKLVISTGGTATQTGSSGDHRFRLSTRQLRALKSDLKAARFSSLKRRYRPSRTVFDGIGQSVTYRGKTVSVSSGASYPKRLARVLERLARHLRR